MSDERPGSLKAAETSAKSGWQADLDPGELRSAKEVFLQLTRTAKILKLYPPNNPIPQRSLEELKARFDGHLKEYGDLRLRVREDELLYQGQVIYKNPNRLESLAFKLYADGIREISFLEGMDLEELTDFLGIINRDFGLADSDDDIVTLLWEHRLPHIGYLVTGDAIPETVSLPAATGPTAIREMAQKEAAQTKEAAVSPDSVLQQCLGIEPETLTEIFALTEEEVASIKSRMEFEKGINPISTLLGILTAIVRLEKGHEAFTDTLEILDRVLETLVVRGDLSHATEILKLYHELLGLDPGLPPGQREQLVKAIEKAGDPQRIKALEPVLNQMDPIQMDQLTPFLLLLTEKACVPLIDLLGTLTQMRARRTVCEVLVQLCKDHVGPLLERLDDPRWFVVRNLLYILRKIGDPKSLNRLEPLVTHPEPRVRKELIHLLDEMKEAKAKHLLTLFLNDPDAAIRVQAIRCLANARYKEATKTILEAMDRKEFLGRDEDEKREWFEALGRIGGNDLIPLFQRLLKEGSQSWLRKAMREEMALCAVAGLRRIGTEEARAVLMEGQRSPRKAIREACARAIKELTR